MRALALIALAVLARSPAAEACTCRLPSVTISPDGDAGVPLNTTVMLWVEQRFVRSGKGGTPSFVLRVAGGRSVAITAKTTGSGETEVVELVPKALLAANTTYEVEVKQDGKVVVRRRFKTGDASSTTAPAWKNQGLAYARYAEPQFWGGGTCMNQDPSLELLWLIDDPKPERLRVGLWVGTTIDLTKPPTTYVTGSKFGPKLGNPTYCASATLTIPKEPKLKIAARLFDFAGNASDAREITVDTTKPEPPFK